MAIKLIVKQESEIPSELKGYYKKDGEVWKLLVEGAASPEELTRINSLLTDERKLTKELNAKLDILADADITEVATLKDLRNELGDDIDPANIKSLITENEELKKSRNTDMASVQDENIDLKRQRAQHLKEISTLKKKYEDAETMRMQLDQKITTSTIAEQVKAAASELKIIPEAMVDVVLNAQAVFELDNTGAAVAKEGQGELLTGTKPKEWLESLQASRPHWWPRSNGAGGQGGSTGYNGENPFSAKTLNLTKQGELYRENPELANRLAQEAAN